MKNKLFLSMLLGVFAGAVALSGCSKNSKTSEVDSIAGRGAGNGLAFFIFNDGNNMIPSIQFVQPSPNGGLAWVQFDSTSSPNAPVTSFSTTNLAGVNAVQVLFVSPQPGIGSYNPPATVLTGSAVPLTPGSSAMMVAVYKVLPTDTVWIPFDSVTILSPGGAPTNLGSPFHITGVGPPSPTPYTCNFKSKGGGQSASVIIVVTSTAMGPSLPPH